MRLAPWIDIGDIVPRSYSDDNDDDGFPTVEELLRFGGESPARLSGSQGATVQIIVRGYELRWSPSR